MENASLTLADMASLKNLIEAATARGAFRANEMSTVKAVKNVRVKYCDTMSLD